MSGFFLSAAEVAKRVGVTEEDVLATLEDLEWAGATRTSDGRVHVVRVAVESLRAEAARRRRS